MQELDFSLDGVWASTVGIYLCAPVTFSQAKPRVETISIAGRSGDLHISDGSYDNRTASVECFVLDATNVTLEMKAVMKFLFSDTGYRKLQVSQDTDHYWYARISNAGEIEPRLNILNKFTIEFDCKPFKMVDGSETFVTETQFINPTGFEAYPRFKVYSASAGGTIAMVDGYITLTDSVVSSNPMYIDCEDGLAYYNGGTSANNKISCTQFPKFYVSNSAQTVSLTNVTADVAPRWRTL